MAKNRTTKQQKVASNLKQSVSKFSGDLESLSSQIAGLTDAIISEKNLAASKIKSEREMLARKTALQNLKDDIDDIRSERKKNQDKLDKLLADQESEEQKQKEELRKKETQYSDSAKKSFEGGQFISGMIFKFLGRNEKDKKQIEAERQADRQDEIQELGNRSKELSEQTKSLKDIRNNISVLNTNIVNVEEERMYEQRDAEKTVSDISKFASVKLLDIEPEALSKLEKIISKSKAADGGGLSLTDAIGSSVILKKTLESFSKLRPLLQGGRGGLGRLAGGIIGKYILPATVAYGMYEGMQSDSVIKNLPSLKGKKPEDIKLSERIRSGKAKTLSLLSFNLIEPETFGKILEHPLAKFLEKIDPLTGIVTAIEELSDVIDRWNPFKPSSKPEDKQNISAGVSDKTKEIINEKLINRVATKYYTPQELTAIQQYVQTESGGENKINPKTYDAGYFQFNPVTVIDTLRKMGRESEYEHILPQITFKDKNQKGSVQSITEEGKTQLANLVIQKSPEEQMKMFQVYIDNLSKGLEKSGKPLTFEALKTYGFGSSPKMIEAISEGKTDPVIYNEEQTAKMTTQPHFKQMMDYSGGNVIKYSGIKQWVDELKKSKFSNNQPPQTPASESTTQPKLSFGNTPMRYPGENIDVVNEKKASEASLLERSKVLRYKELSDKYDEAPQAIKNELESEIKKEEINKQKLKGSSFDWIDADTRYNLRKMYEKETGKSSSTPGLDYNTLNEEIKKKNTNQVPTMEQTQNTNGAKTYTAAANNKAMQQQTQGNNVVAVNNNHVTNNQTTMPNVRPRAEEPFNPYKFLYNLYPPPL